MFIDSRAQQAADTARERIAYCVTMANGDRYYTAIGGRILYDGSRDMGPFSNQWRIVGFKRRSNSRETIVLSSAVGADIGQGHVIDFDHGTFRQWASPVSRRAVKVEFNDTGRDGRPLFEVE